MPVEHGLQWLGDDEGSAFLRQFRGHRGGDRSESGAGDPDFRLADRSERGTGEPCKFFLARPGGGAAYLLAVRKDGDAAIVRLQGKGASIRQNGFGEGDSWFHAGLRREPRCWSYPMGAAMSTVPERASIEAPCSLFWFSHTDNAAIGKKRRASPKFDHRKPDWETHHEKSHPSGFV